MFTKGDYDLQNKIDQYIAGQLTPAQIDELWCELIQDDYHLEYLKNSVNLKHLKKEEHIKITQS